MTLNLALIKSMTSINIQCEQK